MSEPVYLDYNATAPVRPEARAAVEQAMLMIGAIGLALDLVFRRLGKLKSVRWGFRDAS